MLRKNRSWWPFARDSRCMTQASAAVKAQAQGCLLSGCTAPGWSGGSWLACTSLPNAWSARSFIALSSSNIGTKKPVSRASHPTKEVERQQLIKPGAGEQRGREDWGGRGARGLWCYREQAPPPIRSALCYEQDVLLGIPANEKATHMAQKTQLDAESSAKGPQCDWVTFKPSHHDKLLQSGSIT